MADAVLRVDVKGTDNLSPVLKHIESGVIRFVGAISSVLTAITAIGFPIVKTAEFEKELLSVKKTTDFSAAAISTLGEGLLALSSRIDISAADLAKIAAQAGQLGIGARSGVSGILAFTTEIAKAVTALDVSAEEASVSLGKLINIFDIPESQYGNAIAVINQMSNVSTARPEELFDILRRIGNLGKSVTLDQASALSALAVDIGFTAETAGTSLVKIFSNMRAEAIEFAKFMGVSVNEWVNPLINGRGIEQLKAYLTRLNALPEEVAAAAVEKLSGGGRIGSLIDKLRQDMKKGDNSRLDVLLRQAASEMEKGTSAGKEQQNVLSGLSAQWEVLGNRINRVFIQGTQASIPAFTNLLRKVGDSFSNPGTIERFAEVMQVVAKAADAVAAGFEKLGGASSALRALFDVVALAALTRGFAGLREGYKSTVDRVVAENERRIASEQATAQAVAARTAFEQAQDKALRAKAAYGAAKVDLVSKDRALLQAVQAQQAIEEGVTKVSDAATVKRSATLSAALTRRSLLHAAYEQRVLNASRAAEAAATALAQQHEAKLAAIKGRSKAAVAARVDATAIYAEQTAALEKQIAAETALRDAQFRKDLARAEASVRVSKANYNGIVAAAREAALQIAEANRQAASVAQIGASGATFRTGVKMDDSVAELDKLKEAADKAQEHLASLGTGGAVAGNKLSAVYTRATAAGRSFAAEVGITSVAVRAAFGAMTGAIAVTTAGILRLGEAVARLAGAGVAVDALKARLALLNAAIAGGAVGMSLFALRAQQALSLVAFAGKAVMAVFQRLFIVLFAIDMAKWALEKIGALEPLLEFINSLIRKVNQLGFNISTIQLPKEMEEERKKIAAFKEAFDKARAGAEEFQASVGQLSIGGDSPNDKKAFLDSLAERGRAMEAYRVQVADSMKFTLDNPGAVASGIALGADILRKSGAEVESLRFSYDKLAESMAEVAKANPGDAQIASLLKARNALAAAGKLDTEGGRNIAEELARAVAAKQKEQDVTEKLAQTNRALLELDEQRASVYRELAKGLEASYVADVIDTGKIDELIAAKNEYERAKSDFEQYGQAPAIDEKNTERIAAYTQLAEGLDAAKAKLTTVEKSFARIPSVAQITAGKTVAEVTKIFTSFGTAEQQIRGFGIAVDATGKRNTSAFLGMASAAIVTANQYQDSIKQYLANSTAVDVYSAQARAAKVAAEQATAAIRQAYDKAKKDLEDLYAFTQKITQNIEESLAAAKRDRATRGDDIERTREELQLNAEIAREQEQLDARSQYMAAVDYAFHQRMLDEKRKALELTLKDKYERKESLRLTNDNVSSYDGVITKSAAYVGRLREINKLLADDTVPVELTQDLIPERAAILKDLSEMKSKAKDLLETLSTQRDSSGFVPDPEKIKQMARELERVYKAAGAATTEGVKPIADLQTKIANTLELQAKSAQNTLDQLNAGLLDYAEKTNIAMGDMARKSGVTAEKIAQDIASAAVRMQTPINDLGEALTQIGNTSILGRKATDAIALKFKEFKAQAGTLLDDVTITAERVNVAPLEEKLAKAFATGILQAEQNLKTTTVRVDVDKQQMQNAVDVAGTGLSVDVRANILYPDKTGTEDGGAGTGGTGVSGRYAQGGPVRGRGTSLSDSVLGWLGHGEFVMDALTHRMFGTGFMRWMQAMARSGKPGVVKAMLPGFKSGGPASTVFRMESVSKQVISAAGEGGIASGFNQPMSLTIPEIGTIPMLTTEDVAKSLSRQITLATLKRGTRKQRANT